jgi:uncharacterized repeat protein (TIGR01451 family)
MILNRVESTSNIQYNYKIDPGGSSQQTTKNSNTTETDLIVGELSMVKTVDKAYATIGDTLTYTTVVTNTGNILVTDINFTDTIPAGATFVGGSVTIDGTPHPEYDPVTGFALSDLIIAGSTTVTCQVQVASLPDPNILTNISHNSFEYLVVVPITDNSDSNSVITTINITNLSVVKTASASQVTHGDPLIYTITITNIGNIDAEEIQFQDIVPTELTFTTGSVTVNTTPQPTYDPTIGFNLGTLSPSGTITVTFNTTVN